MTLIALVVDVQGREADTLSDALIEAGALSVSCEEADPAAAPLSSSEPGEPASWSRVPSSCGR